MNFQKLIPSLLAGLLLVVADVRAAAPVVDTHLADEKKTAVTIRITETVKIVLPTPTPAPAGYEWQIISNDSRILRLTSSPKPAGSVEKLMAEKSDKATAPDDKASAPAAAGVAWATSFVALRPGRSIVRLVFVKASDSGEETPSDTREIAVTVSTERPAAK